MFVKFTIHFNDINIIMYTWKVHGLSFKEFGQEKVNSVNDLPARSRSFSVSLECRTQISQDTKTAKTLK